jgi:hypothetical protein
MVRRRLNTFAPARFVVPATSVITGASALLTVRFQLVMLTALMLPLSATLVVRFNCPTIGSVRTVVVAARSAVSIGRLARLPILG